MSDKSELNGKEKVRLNSFKHGLRSNSLVIAPNNHEESLSDYDALFESLSVLIKPSNVFEEHCVHSMAKAMFRLRRADALEAGLFTSSDPRFEIDIFSKNKNAVLNLRNPAMLDLILRYRASISNEITKALSSIHTYRNCFQYDLFDKDEVKDAKSS